MKQGTNNEIDLLLRRLSGRRDASMTDAELRLDEDHLDADELSSYAENALPAAARARYTEHIADCSRCRELVVGLSSSVGLVSADQAATVFEPSGLKKFLASLFSPMVLRYAVPALGVLVVMIIGFAALRRDRMSESVVQLKEMDQKKQVATANQQPAPSPEVFNYSSERAPTPAAGRLADANKPAQDAAAPPPPNTPPSVAVTTDVKPAAAAPKLEQQPVANEAPPAAKVAATSDETKTVNVEARKQTIENRVVIDLPVQKPAELAKEQERRAEDAAAARSGPARSKAEFGVASPRARQNVQRDGAEKRESADKKDNDDAETKSVAGRHFRKQRGVWIDTAYETSRSPITVTRGSEQFRALVADEPAIKTIAEQLHGEIIVVWKGSAYRIR